MPMLGVKGWIDMLDASEPVYSSEDVTAGLEPRLIGWLSPAQQMGVTKQHPLDMVFVPPIVIYRNQDELRDWHEQVESQEVRVAEAVAQVAAIDDEAERRSLLNRHFPQNRHACEYPGTCGMVKVCWGGEDIKREPLASGLYKIRTINHPQEGVK